ncbi:MAG: ABC transporter permease [Candidatus Omnitrophica bacterium]|nr:ABC transporter permease [Candidatus Omnitrophota bacterium]MCK5259621.1 ABC transporter permease [Candidatus Omnitrophota bacterium]
MLTNIVFYSGNIIFRFIRYVGELTLLFGRTLYHIFTPPFKMYRVLSQAKRIGPGSFLIAALVAFFIGMIMALQMAYLMLEMSAEIYIPSVVAVSLTRELAPVLTALIVAGRIGAGITAEIGSMTVTEQVDALRAFAVNPVKYLVVPRFLGLVIMLPILTVFADLVGIMGGFVICVYKLYISPTLYFTMVTEALTVKDIVTGLTKTVCFGAIIALVGCHQGLNVQSGAEGVGRSTTTAVVISFILIIIADCFFTTLFYFILRI